MGQTLFAPPNVKGWDGGKSWVSTATLLFRYNFADYLLNGTAQQSKAPPHQLQRDPIDVTKLLPEEVRQDPVELMAALRRRLCQVPLSAKQIETLLAYLKAQGGNPNDQALRRVFHLMMSTPEFQLI